LVSLWKPNMFALVLNRHLTTLTTTGQVGQRGHPDHLTLAKTLVFETPKVLIESTGELVDKSSQNYILKLPSQFEWVRMSP
jgi:hypothetical protein